MKRRVGSGRDGEGLRRGGEGGRGNQGDQSRIMDREVRMLDKGRTFQVPADQAKWENLRENDRVKVRHRTGKYTGTIWAAEIEQAAVSAAL